MNTRDDTNMQSIIGYKKAGDCSDAVRRRKMWM